MMTCQYILIACLSFVVVVYGIQWPIPYQRVTSRPTNIPYCQAGLITFCPTGKTQDAMIYADDNDTIEIFALKKPVWSFKFGDLMAQFVSFLFRKIKIFICFCYKNRKLCMMQ
jgi:ceroid-lipofuscinosis neuronal protein 5